MTIKTLLFVEFQILLVVAVAALLIWRYWYLPQKLEALRVPSAVQVAPAPPAAAPVAAPVPLAAPAATPAAPVVAVPSLLKNGQFAERLTHWTLWRDAKIYSNAVHVITAPGPAGDRMVLRIENPYKAQVGVQQLARVVSGQVYRLSASVRSVATHDTNAIFGGRVAFYLQPQQEQEIVWMTEYNQWWRRELVFTNLVDGVATVYAHLGYGGVATTGEFMHIALEKVEP